MLNFIKKNWFLFSLILLISITLGDTTETVSAMGKLLKEKLGTDSIIFLIFFCSGLILNIEQVQSGIKDIRGIIISLILIFIAAPLAGYLISKLPLIEDIKIGLFLVSVMPTTLSSGVVMTGFAGGNIAHALLITIISNSLAVFTIPVTLSLLLSYAGNSISVSIDKTAMMVKIALYVLLPLVAGMSFKYYSERRGSSLIEKYRSIFQIINLILVAGVVWMGISHARSLIMERGSDLWTVLMIVILFHTAMIFISLFTIKTLKLEKRKRESVVLMGIQKTLALSIVIQVTLFPQFGLALVFCVMHHIIHLIMDTYLAGLLNRYS